MPEGPEIETVKETLKRQILNKEIKAIKVIYEPIMPEGKTVDLTGEKIIDIDRMGKFLIFKLTTHVLVAHLRMEGKFFIKENENHVKHEHVAIYFTDGTSLRYYDVRKFGRILIKTYDNYLKTPPLSKLGPSPKNITTNYLFEKFKNKKTPIKVALLDQTIMTDLGNIYVDETLFLAKIMPTRLANQVSYDEVELIIEKANQVLDKAISLGGTTIYSYQSSEGVTGFFQNELQVHTKANSPCPICQTKIIKIKVGGRGTYVCENCQK